MSPFPLALGERVMAPFCAASFRSSIREHLAGDPGHRRAAAHPGGE